jgi:hypothetical protein
MPSGGDVTADHGAAGGPCRSRPGDEVRRAPARRPMKPCTESGEERSGRHAASGVSAPGWGRGGLHEGQGRAENMSAKQFTGEMRQAPSKARVTGLFSTQ